MNRPEILQDFLSTTCRCGAPKKTRQSFCRTDFFRLSLNLRSRLHMKFGEGYEEAFTDALTVLGFIAENDPLSRFAGDSWHVDYCLDDDAREVRNMTHYADPYNMEGLIEKNPAIESQQCFHAENEDGLALFGLAEEFCNDDMDEVFTHRISVESARQLAHMLAQAAAAAEKSRAENEVREQKIQARIDSQNLPFGDGI